MFSQDRLSAGQGQSFCQSNPLPTSGEGTPEVPMNPPMKPRRPGLRPGPRPYPAMMVVPALPRARSLARLAERQVDPTGSKVRMPPLLQRLHAVEPQPRRAAPDHDVSMGQRDSPRAVGAAMSAEQEYRRQPQ